MPRGNIASLEIEPMAVSATTTTTNGSRHAEQQTHNQQQQRPVFSSFRYRVKQLIMLIKLYTQIYPMITSCIAAIGVAMLFFSLLLNFRKPVTRNKLYHDYSKLDLKHNVEAANIDHWCLWGGDEQCTCDDFTEPTPRTATVKGWLDVHDANVASIDIAINYDVVFYGDELVEGWKGHHLGSTMSNLPVGESNATRDYFMEHFSRESGGAFDGVALGIMGDVAPNLLWRLRHNEMPKDLNAKVFWLAIGMNDMVRGGCSEEATFLGILRVADEIYFSNPESVIVIQGLLPWSRASNGNLDPTPHGFRPFKGKKVTEFSVKEAKKTFSYWPSIQHINSELEKFCSEHEHLVYFDGSGLFLGSMGNHVYKPKNQQIITALLEDGKRLTLEGYQVLGSAIERELNRIIYENDENNDIEKKNGN